jgi:hypothetical protein
MRAFVKKLARIGRHVHKFGVVTLGQVNVLSRMIFIAHGVALIVKMPRTFLSLQAEVRS